MSKKEFVVDLEVNVDILLGKVGINEVPSGLSEALNDFWEDNWSCESNNGKLSMSFVGNCVNVPRVGESLSDNSNLENLIEQFFSENRDVLNEYIGAANLDLPHLFTYSFTVQEVFYIPVRLYVQDKEDEPDFYIPHVKCRFGWELK